jgi:hypothetical protein
VRPTPDHSDFVRLCYTDGPFVSSGRHGESIWDAPLRQAKLSAKLRRSHPDHTAFGLVTTFYTFMPPSGLCRARPIIEGRAPGTAAFFTCRSLGIIHAPILVASTVPQGIGTRKVGVNAVRYHADAKPLASLTAL